MKLKKKASSVLKRKKISGINFDGETINLNSHGRHLEMAIKGSLYNKIFFCCSFNILETGIACSLTQRDLQSPSGAY